MNCKPGDLAYLRDDDFPENNGRIVEVVAPAAIIDAMGPGFWWEVRSIGVMLAYSWHGEDEIAGYGLEADVRDCDLRRISGVPLDDGTAIPTNVPEALRLALGIESRSYT